MKRGKVVTVILALVLGSCTDMLNDKPDISPELIGKWELTSFVTGSGAVYTLPCTFQSTEINSGGYEFGEDTLTHYLNGEFIRKLRNLYTEEDKLFAVTSSTELGSWVIEGDRLSIFPGVSAPNTGSTPVRPVEENIFIRVDKFSWE